MLTNAKASSLTAATLLALVAACGSGQPGMVKQGRSVQASNGLETENGLSPVIITASCLTLDGMVSDTTTTTDPTATTDPTVTTDPTLVTDPALDPSLDVSTDVTVDTSVDTATAGGDVSVASCGDMMNGLTPNLLGNIGLRPNSLNTPQFQKWFEADRAATGMLMKYVVRCSLPAEDVLSYVDSDGNTWSWAGGFALAPNWAAGKGIPESEQQLVSACIAAHANKYGVHVPISVLANHIDGSPIPYTASELSTYSVTEGCFFGNLFKKDGVFAGDDRAMTLTDAESSLRACALPDRSGGTASNCAPIKYAGSCGAMCKTDPTGLYYTACKVNGKTYRPVSTRIMPQFNYKCGDGVCQRSESCGTGTTFDNCGLDCGPCN
ncbi:MAG: hypothetical protein ABR567_07410 [Myxococcales bacterium]|nr:hypothetical protein [Myxococcales bacterium]